MSLHLSRTNKCNQRKKSATTASNLHFRRGVSPRLQESLKLKRYKCRLCLYFVLPLSANYLCHMGEYSTSSPTNTHTQRETVSKGNTPCNAIKANGERQITKATMPHCHFPVASWWLLVATFYFHLSAALFLSLLLFAFPLRLSLAGSWSLLFSFPLFNASACQRS